MQKGLSQCMTTPYFSLVEATHHQANAGLRPVLRGVCALKPEQNLQHTFDDHNTPTYSTSSCPHRNKLENR